MPQSITAADGTKVNYSYFSDGSKFRAVSDNGEKLIYAGSLRLKIENYDSVPESFAIAGGRVKYDNGSWQTEYYITDHLGSVWAVTDTLGNVLATFDYTPYGELLAATDNTATGTDHLFTGKEQQSKLGVSELYDSQARFMGTDGRFTSMDPLAEKYYHLSPYAYCAGDPVNLVDPDGRKLRITGVQQNTTLELLSELFGSELKLEDDFVTITNEPKQYNTNSKLIAEIIDNKNIIVELRTTDGKVTKDGTLFCGGAFMGSKTEYSDGQKLVYTYQDINLNVLQKVDEYEGYQGRSLMHELSESYYGGIYAYNNNRYIVKAAIGINSSNINEHEVYSFAHTQAIPTASVIRKFYKNRKEVFGISNFDYCVWFINNNGEEIPVQVYNNKSR